jgi:hypothetical protein
MKLLRLPLVALCLVGSLVPGRAAMLMVTTNGAITGPTGFVATAFLSGSNLAVEPTNWTVSGQKLWGVRFHVPAAGTGGGATAFDIQTNTVPALLSAASLNLIPGANVTFYTTNRGTTNDLQITAAIVGGAASLADVTNVVNSADLTNGGAKTLAYAVGANNTNFAYAIVAAASNLSYAIGANGTNFAYGIVAAASNLSYAIGANGTNFAYSLGANNTNFAYAIVAAASNLSYAIGANGTNFAYSLGANNTNFAYGIVAAASNLSYAIGTASTNYASSRQNGSAVLTNLTAAGITNWAGAGSTVLTTNNGTITFTTTIAGAPTIVTNSIWVPAGAWTPASNAPSTGLITNSNWSVTDTYDFDDTAVETISTTYAPGQTFAGNLKLLIYWRTAHPFDEKTNIWWEVAVNPIAAGETFGAFTYKTNYTTPNAWSYVSNTVMVSSVPLLNITNLTATALLDIRLCRTNTGGATNLLGDARFIGATIQTTSTNWMGGHQ